MRRLIIKAEESDLYYCIGEYNAGMASSLEETIATGKLIERGNSFCEWVPVGEQLPPEGEMVLVTCKPKKGEPNINRAYYDGFWHGSGSMSNVIAWAYLPLPFMEDTK